MADADDFAHLGMPTPLARVIAEAINDTDGGEALVVAEQALGVAQGAESTAADAEQTANDALDIVEDVSEALDGAVSNATAALEAAEQAQTDAASALDVAEGAEETANSAYDYADTANTAAGNAQSTANSAVQTANGSVSIAEAAELAANNAVLAANDAQSDANDAIQAASDAQDTADSAVSTANGAVVAANDAADRAEQAANDAQAAMGNIVTYYVEDDAERLGLTPSVDETAFVSETGHIWEWDGSNWVDRGAVPFATELEVSGVRQNMAKSFVTRQQAVDAGQGVLSGTIGPILIRNGAYLELRGPGVTEDQLFPEHPTWGVLDKYPRDALFTTVAGQVGVVPLVNQSVTVTEGVSYITADIAPASLDAGITITSGGSQVRLPLPLGLSGPLRLQVSGDSDRPIFNETNVTQMTSSDVEQGGNLILYRRGSNWVTQSGAVGSTTIAGIKNRLSLFGEPVNGFESGNTGGYLVLGTGAIASASASWTFTGFIPVRTGQVVEYIGQISRDSGAAVALYDLNQGYLYDGLVADPEIPGGQQQVSGSVTIPDGVAFIRAASFNGVTHAINYLPLGDGDSGGGMAEVSAEDVIEVLETASGTYKVRLKSAIDAILNDTSLMPHRLANLPGIGDSFTVGGNATSPANRYLNRVAAALGATVTNLAQGGRILQNSPIAGGSPQPNNGRDRFRALVTGAEHKDFVLIAYGFNDARYTAAPASVTAANYKSDYREIIAGLLADGYRRDQILIVGPHYITDVGLNTGSDGFTGQTRAGFEDYVTAAQEVAEEFGVLYFDSYAYMAANGGASLISDDDIHPNNLGHEVIATGIIEETTVLNQRPAATVIDFRSTPDAIHMAWTPVAGAVSYDYTLVEYDDLNIPGTPVNTSGTSAEMSTAPLGMKAVLMVRPVFSDGAGPWSASSPVDV